MIGHVWGMSTYAMAFTGFFAIILFVACISDLMKWRHNFSDSLLLCLLIGFGVCGVIAIVSSAFALIASTLWLLFGWW